MELHTSGDWSDQVTAVDPGIITELELGDSENVVILIDREGERDMKSL